MIRILSIAAIPIILTVFFFAVRSAFPVAWEAWLGRVSRYSIWIYLVMMILFVALVSNGGFRTTNEIFRRITGIAAFTSTSILMVFASLAASALIWWPLAKLAKIKSNAGIGTILTKTSALVAMIAVALVPLGFFLGFGRPIVRRIRLEASQHRHLSGLTILHLSDVHMGPFIGEAQIEHIASLVKNDEIDLIALTGDIADDLDKYPQFFSALSKIKSRHGIKACIGNHEIYRGRALSIQAQEKGGAEMLIDRHTTIDVNGAPLHIVGIDDPAGLGRSTQAFYKKHFTTSFQSIPDDEATLVLCHRPDGFNACIEHGGTVMLSGHTHGGQVALFNRSVFEPIARQSGHKLLGPYTAPAQKRQATSQLYVTAGTGHWMPFRLGCPAEAVLYTFT